MSNEIEDFRQQARQMAKEQAKQMAKDAAKKVAKEIWAAIVPYLPWIIGIFLGFIVIVGCIPWNDLMVTASAADLTSASSSSWEQFIRYMHSIEGHTGKKEVDGVEYYQVGGVWSESLQRYTRTVGYGIDLDTSGYETVLKEEFGVENLQIGDWVKAEYIDYCEDLELNNAKKAVETAFVNVGIEVPTYQIYALTSFCYNNGTGVINSFYGGKGIAGAYKEFYSGVNNSKYYKYDEWSEDTENFKNKIQNNTDYVDFQLNEYASKFNEYTNSGQLTNRRQADWCLFQTGYYGYGLGIQGYGNGINEYWVASKDGGNYATDDRKYVYGTFTSDITGRTFTIIHQNGSMDGIDKILPGQCNRAAGATVLSGYYPGSVEDLVRRAMNDTYASGFPFNSVKLYEGYGLNVEDASSKISNYQSYIKGELLKGNYILIRFDQPTKGKSGSTWSGSDGHWFSILGYKQEDGKDKIFTGEPAYNNNKWYDLDEFENVKNKMQYLYVVIPTK